MGNADTSGRSWKTEENMKMLAESFQKLMRTDRPEKQVGGDSWVGYVLGTMGCLKGRFCDITFRALLIMRYAEEYVR